MMRIMRRRWRTRRNSTKEEETATVLLALTRPSMWLHSITIVSTY